MSSPEQNYFFIFAMRYPVVPLINLTSYKKKFVPIIQLHLSLSNLVKMILYLPDYNGGMGVILEAHFYRFWADTR